MPLMSLECNLVYIFGVHFDLGVTGPQIEFREREKLCTVQFIQKLFYHRYGKFVLDGDIV